MCISECQNQKDLEILSNVYIITLKKYGTRDNFILQMFFYLAGSATFKFYFQATKRIRGEINRRRSSKKSRGAGRQKSRGRIREEEGRNRS